MSSRRVDPELAHHRARLAHAVRYGNAEAAEQARHDLSVARGENAIRKLVEGWPPLSDETRARLAALLAPSEEDGGDG